MVQSQKRQHRPVMAGEFDLPDVFINYQDVVAEVERGFMESNIRPVTITSFHDEMEEKLKSFRETLEQLMAEDWSAYFPEIPFSRDDLKRALDLAVIKKRKEIVKNLETQISDSRKIFMIKHWVFKSWAFRFIVTGLTSLITLPTFAWLAALPHDSTLVIGGLGLVANVFALGFSLFKNLTE